MDDLIDQLVALPELESVSLEGAVDDSGMKALAAHADGLSATTLDLGETQVTNRGMAELESLTRVKMLTINTNPLIDDAGLSYISRMPALRKLWIIEENSAADPERFSHVGFNHIGTATRLESLLLLNLRVTQQMAMTLRNLENLRSLSLFHCEISMDSVTSLRRALPNCEIVVRD